jgi:hypothetical protein
VRVRVRVRVAFAEEFASRGREEKSIVFDLAWRLAQPRALVCGGLDDAPATPYSNNLFLFFMNYQ